MEKNEGKKNWTLQKASDFWDEHDLFEFRDVKEVKDLQFNLKDRRYIGLDAKLYGKILKEARRSHKTMEHLIEEWLQQKIEHAA